MIKKHISFKNIFCFFYFLSFFCFLNCGRQVPPKWKDIINSCEQKKELPAKKIKKREESLSPYKIILYIDVSGSMQGFVSESSIFSKTVAKLRQTKEIFFDKAKRSTPNIELRLVDSNIKPVESILSLEIIAKDRNIFVGKFTNLCAIFNEISDITEKYNGRPHLFILVSDGVPDYPKADILHECAAGTDQFGVWINLSNLINKLNMAAAIIGIKSQFEGNVESIVLKSRGLSLKEPKYISGNNNDKFRPFYIYILSPVQYFVDNFIEWFKQEQEEKFEIFPLTGKIVDESYSRFNVIKKSIEKYDSKNFRLYKDEKAPRSNCFILLINKDYSENEPFEFSLTMDLKWDKKYEKYLEGDIIYKMLDISKPILCINHSIDENNETIPILEILEKRGEKSNTLEFKAYWQDKHKIKKWGAYCINIFLKPDRETLPRWVEDWSTNDDSEIEKFSKTFELKSQLRSLWNNESITKNIVAKLYFKIYEK